VNSDLKRQAREAFATHRWQPAGCWRVESPKHAIELAAAAKDNAEMQAIVHLGALAFTDADPAPHLAYFGLEVCDCPEYGCGRCGDTGAAEILTGHAGDAAIAA
jgi:hypothetical protein